MIAVFALALLSAAQSPLGKDGFVTTTDGVRLHYIEAGKGPSVLLVPGWTMPAWIWEPQIRELAKNYHVVAMDPRSQGESDKPAEGHYIDRRAQDIFELVTQLKLPPVVLVGWSLGVPEVLTYVDRFGTTTVRGLVLVDGMVGSDPDPKAALGVPAWLMSMQKDRQKFAAEFVKGMYRKPQSDAYLQRVTDASLKTPTNSAVLLLANIRGGDWRPVLEKVDKPVLCTVTGSMKAAGEAVKTRLPSAQVEVFEGAGHALFVDDADKFNAVLVEFLIKTAKP